MSLCRRCLTTITPAVHDIVVSEIPETISSAQLPRAIFKYVHHKLRIRPSDAPADPTLPQIGAPEASASSSTGREGLEIPNPFLLQKRPFLVDRVDGTIAQFDRYKQHFPVRQQKKLLEKHSRYHLPPSSVNPIPSPPKVIWHQQGEHFGREISWEGVWGIKEKKGVYARRKVMFKGHKRERDRPERDAQTDERVKDMPRRVEEWRSVRSSR